MAFEAFSIVGKIAVEGSEQAKQQLEKVGVSAEQVQKDSGSPAPHSQQPAPLG